MLTDLLNPKRRSKHHDPTRRTDPRPAIRPEREAMPRMRWYA